MQLVKTERDNLLRPLQTVSGIVERRHTLPILANLLITKTGADVSFLSTDLELQITTRADFGTGSDQVATTVAARKLLDILRAMPPGEVSLDLTDKKLTVRSGKSRERHIDLTVLKVFDRLLLERQARVFSAA